MLNRLATSVRGGQCGTAILCWALASWAQGVAAQVSGPPAKPQLAPLSSLRRESPPAGQVALGRLLFFDGRLSGDATTSCGACHEPEKAWADGAPLARGYPGSLYFRNTPTLLDAAGQRVLYWDGRLSGDDLPALVRDHISEAHFMQADGRLVIERLRQTPAYAQMFHDAAGGEVTYGRILGAVAAYVRTLRSPPTALDRFLEGDDNSLTPKQRAGLELFRGKAGCVRCHHGPLLNDGQFHRLDPPGNPAVFTEPLRHITFRRFFRTLGVSRYGQLREDIGRWAITKQPRDWGRFRTPSLRAVASTAPYMHNGSLATLSEVVDFYDRGGGPEQSANLRPLSLSEDERRSLVALLKLLVAPAQTEPRPELPPYQSRSLGDGQR